MDEQREFSFVTCLEWWIVEPDWRYRRGDVGTDEASRRIRSQGRRKLQMNDVQEHEAFGAVRHRWETEDGSSAYLEAVQTDPPPGRIEGGLHTRRGGGDVEQDGLLDLTRLADREALAAEKRQRLAFTTTMDRYSCDTRLIY